MLFDGEVVLNEADAGVVISEVNTLRQVLEFIVCGEANSSRTIVVFANVLKRSFFLITI